MLILLFFPAVADATTSCPESLRISDLRTIKIPLDANDAERKSAKTLNSYLKKLYGLDLDITPWSPASKATDAIVVGRAAITAGMIIAGELDEVREEGYVIKVRKKSIAIAGYAPQGTLYAGYALLRRMGLKLYPWHAQNPLEVFAPLADGRMETLEVSDKPFFELRDAFQPL